MTRVLIPILLLIILIVPLGACNPEGPTGPSAFSVFRVYGLWKMRMESPGCAPGEVLALDFGPFGLSATGDSVRVTGRWFLDEMNPTTYPLSGFIYKLSGLASFKLDIQDTKSIEGVFVSNEDFAGAYRELDECVVRLRGKFIE